MEIINYIQEPRRRSSAGFFKKTFGAIPRQSRIKTKTRSDVAYSFSFPEEKHIFRAGRVKQPFSLKLVFAAVGKALSYTGDFIVENYKILLGIIGALGIITAASFYSIKLYNFRQNHTGPIILNPEDKTDFDNLDKFMFSFALEEKNEVDSEGNLLGVELTSVTSLIAQPVVFQNYKVKSGDTISGITKKFGLKNISTLISVNDISNVRQLAAGQKLKIPSMDGVVYVVKKGDSIDSISKKYNIKFETLLDVNELLTEELNVGQVLFIPGVGLDRQTLQNAMGELFILPIAAPFRWTSDYGWREDPITGVRSFHTGTDMACPQGTPILASQSGRVSSVGYNRIYGNFIIIDHGNGYQTLYAHQYKTIAKKGQWVSQGTKIGLVGSTGYSTGNHLHFMVYKNGNRINPMSVLKK